jgi:hypothetical protein
VAKNNEPKVAVDATGNVQVANQYRTGLSGSPSAGENTN